MKLTHFMETNRYISKELLWYIAEGYQLRFDCDVMITFDMKGYSYQAAHIDPIPIQWYETDLDQINPKTNIQTYTANVEMIGDYRTGERVRVAYFAELNRLYIMPVESPVIVPAQTSKSDSPFYVQRTDETLIAYGHRLFKAGKLDNPQVRWEYQKTVFKTLFQKLTRK